MFIKKNIFRSITTLIAVLSCASCAHRGHDPGDVFLEYNADYKKKVKGVYIVHRNGEKKIEFVGYSEQEKSEILNSKSRVIASVANTPERSGQSSEVQKVPVTIISNGKGFLVGPQSQSKKSGRD
jgi:hypothetical protein